jgi:hypothetical protein
VADKMRVVATLQIHAQRSLVFVRPVSPMENKPDDARFSKAAREIQTRVV